MGSYWQGSFMLRSQKCEDIKKRKDLYGDFQHIGKEHQNNCLYYIEIEKVIQSDTDEHENRVVYQLTDGKDFHIHEFDISNDGKRLYLWRHQAQIWQII